MLLHLLGAAAGYAGKKFMESETGQKLKESFEKELTNAIDDTFGDLANPELEELKNDIPMIFGGSLSDYIDHLKTGPLTKWVWSSPEKDNTELVVRKSDWNNWEGKIKKYLMKETKWEPVLNKYKHLRIVEDDDVELKIFDLKFGPDDYWKVFSYHGFGNAGYFFLKSTFNKWEGEVKKYYPVEMAGNIIDEWLETLETRSRKLLDDEELEKIKESYPDASEYKNGEMVESEK